MTPASPAANTQTLGHLLGSLAAAPDVMINGVTLDSRTIQGGELFLALPGDVHDGRHFIEQAVASGAAAVVAQAPVAGFVDAVPVPLVEIPELQHEAGVIASRFYNEPSESLRLVGVTGTNGKTTVSRLAAQLARRLGRQCGVIGTLGASLDDSIVDAANTTPDAVALQRQMAVWRDAGVDMVSMEVSSHALVQGRVNGLAFDTAIYTNLSHDHLDFHGDMAAYGRAKLRLFQFAGLQSAVINFDDPFSSQVVAALPEGVEVFGYSIHDHPSACISVSHASWTAKGVEASISTPWGQGVFRSPLPGDFNLGNVAAAVASVVLAGESLEQVLAQVEHLSPVPGRLQSVPNDIGVQVIVDYAHTPDALEHVLAALRPGVAGRLVTVFGCGGDRDAAKRPVMGCVACDGSDAVIVTSDNPRSEPPMAILLDIESGCRGDYRLVVDRAQAIAMAVAEAQPGDCVLIAGKGHEDYQIIDDARIDFSDEAHAQSALARRLQA